MWSRRPYSIILISGYTNSGKDTIGRNLTSYHNYHRVAFADALKDEVAEIYGIDRASLDTQEGKETLFDDTRTARDLLISHGKQRRQEDPNYWTKKVVDQIRNYEKVVITDWRFPHEYDVICFEFGEETVHTWRVNRYGRVLANMDESETSLNGWNFDHVFDNNDSIGVLFREVDSVVDDRNFHRF